MSVASFPDLKARLSEALGDRSKAHLSTDGYVPAAVLVPLYERDGQPWVLFTRRTEEVAHHKGQLSFPGGAWEDGESLRDTALRESFEEIGLQTRDVEVLGELDDACTRSQFHISPFVGVVPHPYPFRLNLRETRELVGIPVAALCRKDNFWEDGRVTGHSLETVYYYRYETNLVWGATARILKQFLELACPQETNVVHS